MAKNTDLGVRGTAVFFIPVRMRVPLKFGAETMTEVTLSRVRMRVRGRGGRVAEGWGETPLSAQWAWPGTLPLAERTGRMQRFCGVLAEAWSGFPARGHALEVGYDFQSQMLDWLLARFNSGEREPMPHLAALICCSAFDLALHDAYGRLHNVPTYSTYTAKFLSRDLADMMEPAEGGPSFKGLYPADFLVKKPPQSLRAWHLVGGLDALEKKDLTGAEPEDGHPVLLRDWIRRDGLKCLKVKLRGTDAAWDESRLLRVGRIAMEEGVEWLTADFNCTVTDPAYVCDILDRLRDREPRLYGMLLYVEQPFPYELERHRIPAHSVAARKPLFLDESAHDWRMVRLGRELGWTGVALKTCKTQTGALLAACWARAHGMTLMVQDLTNPMLAQIPHVLLAAHVGTIMGVETNGMQFYPAASKPEARVHPGLYRRRRGVVRLGTIRGAGFGYRLEEMRRELPAAVAEFGD
jgi:L-alanine-DL-glutamate epimerase-like enolase superfamily enzyme